MKKYDFSKARDLIEAEKEILAEAILIMNRCKNTSKKQNALGESTKHSPEHFPLRVLIFSGQS